MKPADGANFQQRVGQGSVNFGEPATINSWASWLEKFWVS